MHLCATPPNSLWILFICARDYAPTNRPPIGCLACFSPDFPLPARCTSVLTKIRDAPLPTLQSLATPEKKLKDDGQYVRRNHRQFEILHRLQEPDGLDLEWPVGRDNTHVVHVVQAVSRQKSLSVQDQDGVGEEQPRLEEVDGDERVRCCVEICNDFGAELQFASEVVHPP